MSRIPKIVFFALIVRPVVLFVLGLNKRGMNNLPRNGPAVLAANHNSHLDTLVLMSLYPLSALHKLRPVAAADYFFRNAILKWFALNCIGIVPLDRTGETDRAKLFAPCHKALDQGDILILYPEGSRGKPEERGRLRKGLFYLLKERKETPVTPVLMNGLGYALPKGEALIVPYCCDVIIGRAIKTENNPTQFIEHLSDSFSELEQYCLSKELR